MALSVAQERLWFIDQLDPGLPTYNIPVAMRLSGAVDVPTLERCLREIVRRHETLKTRFASVRGEPVQVITEESQLELPITDLRGVSERESEAERLLVEEARRPFDLTQDLMLRARLIHLEQEEYVLLVVIHHIASDGWSMPIFFRELEALYAAYTTGKASPLPELPIQYADFAQWQREWLIGKELSQQLTYWKEQLEGAPPTLEVPTDRPRPAVQTFRGAQQEFRLSDDLAEALADLSRQEGCTLFMTLLAAFQTLLCRYTSQEDIVVGSPIANRNRTEIEEPIGFFVNTLVLRTGLSGNPTFRELLGRVREVTLGAYAHQDLPFEKLVEELQPERDRSHSPLFQVMFVLQSTPWKPHLLVA